jgi:hypothetical protein
VKIIRKWSDVYTVPDYWDSGSILAKHRIYSIWNDEVNYPCDAYGVRVPKGYSSINEKFRDASKKKVFVFGGSTTFGWYLDYEQTIPYHLENASPSASFFNFGVPGSDITQSLYMLQDLLRINLVPNHVLFIDGINEKQGYIQALSGAPKYENRSNSFDLINGRFQTSKQTFIDSICSRILGKVQKLDRLASASSENALRFVKSQSEVYRLSRAFAYRLAKCYGFSTTFVLQPVVWDILANDYNYDHEEMRRWSYLRALYADIILNDANNVVDLRPQSKNVLTPEMFIDWQHVNGDGNIALAHIINSQM